MTVRAYQIPPKEVPDYWQTVVGWLELAYGKNDIPLPITTLDDLLKGHKQLWVAYAEAPENKILCATLTRLAKMRRGLHCEIVAAGGNEAERWVGLISQIEDWARLEGSRSWSGSGSWSRSGSWSE